MTFNPRLTRLPSAQAGERLSARVARVAAILDCDKSQVYRLINTGELEAHGLGRRGVRVYLDSVDAYRERQAKVPVGTPATRRLVIKSGCSPASRAAHLAAVAKLRDDGIL
jgi:excisionase family DNA binding protein